MNGTFLSCLLSFFLPLTYYAYSLLVQRIIVEFYDTAGHTHTLGRTPLDEGSARLTVYDNTQLTRDMTLVRFQATIPARERPQTNDFNSGAIGMG
jgi:hypothetical protein